MKKEIKEKIIEILRKIDELHTEYLDKVADQILELFEEEIKKSILENNDCIKAWEDLRGKIK